MTPRTLQPDPPGVGLPSSRWRSSLLSVELLAGMQRYCRRPSLPLVASRPVRCASLRRGGRCSPGRRCSLTMPLGAWLLSRFRIGDLMPVADAGDDRRSTGLRARTVDAVLHRGHGDPRTRLGSPRDRAAGRSAGTTHEVPPARPCRDVRCLAASRRSSPQSTPSRSPRCRLALGARALPAPPAGGPDDDRSLPSTGVGRVTHRGGAVAMVGGARCRCRAALAAGRRAVHGGGRRRWRPDAPGRVGAACRRTPSRRHPDAERGCPPSW